MSDITGRSGELFVFVTIVEKGGVSAGARALGIVPSTASRMLMRLENRIGVRLIVRDGRIFRLTKEGEACYKSAKNILADLDELEQTLGDNKNPRGVLRISASVAFGRLYILPLLEEFQLQYSEVSVQIMLTDRIVNLEDSEADVAIRIGQLPDSDLKVRKLMESPRILVAAPSYLKRMGIPKHPHELEKHSCLKLRTSDKPIVWSFFNEEISLNISPAGSINVDNGETLVQLATEGLGIAKVGQFHVIEQIASGKLVQILEEWLSYETDTIQVVFVGRPLVSGRVRAFIDFITKNIQTVSKYK